MKKVVFMIVAVLVLCSTFALAREEVNVIITPKPVAKGFRVAEGVASSNLGPEVNVRHHFSQFEGVAARVSPETLEELQANPFYEITKARMFYATLDNSIPQIEANATWDLQLSSTNLTGTGEAVCIIDTGVNYTHAAFGGCYGNNSADSNCTVIGGWDYANDDWDPMDDNGHGTHVAGIVASNDSTYRGVAYGAHLVVIKALSSDGSGFDSDIIAGVDWCVNNASTFNISVISLSLSDCTNFSSYCDGSYPTWAASVNAAAAKNISVIAAAGNGPYGGCLGEPITSLGGPASPACLENATAVGAINSSDEIWPQYQRGALFQLFAPGIAIRSTVFSGGFGFNGGTSMAAPHVSGAVALLQQMARLQSDTYFLPTQIETAFNATGLRINDTKGTNLNYSRIDVYEAARSLDATAPSTTLVSPGNATVDISLNQTFTCNFTDWQLSNTTLYVWNSSGLYNSSSVNVSGTGNASSFNLTNMLPETYTWNCLTADTKANLLFAASNFTVTTGGILVELSSPANATQTKTSAHNFTCNITTDIVRSLANVTFYLWNSTSLSYSSSSNVGGTENQSVFNYSFSDDGNYSWNCLGVNNASESSFATSNYSLEFDGSAPAISDIGTSATTTALTISWTTDEPANSTLSGDLSASSAPYGLSHSLTGTGLASGTEYDYYISSCDSFGNCAATSQQTTRTEYSGGGGGGGSSSNLPSLESVETVEEKAALVISSNELMQGTTVNFEKGQGLNFSVGGAPHSIALENLSRDSVTLTIQSDPLTLVLFPGEVYKMNVSSSTHYDLLLRLESYNLELGTVTLFLQAIKEEIVTGEELVVEEPSQNARSIDYAALMLILVLLAILGFLATKKLKRTKPLHSHESKKAKAKTKRKR